MGIFNYYKNEYEKLVKEGKVPPREERLKSVTGAPPLFRRP